MRRYREGVARTFADKFALIRIRMKRPSQPFIRERVAEEKGRERRRRRRRSGRIRWIVIYAFGVRVVPRDPRPSARIRHLKAGSRVREYLSLSAADHHRSLAFPLLQDAPLASSSSSSSPLEGFSTRIPAGFSSGRRERMRAPVD